MQIPTPNLARDSTQYMFWGKRLTESIHYFWRKDRKVKKYIERHTWQVLMFAALQMSLSRLSPKYSPNEIKSQGCETPFSAGWKGRVKRHKWATTTGGKKKKKDAHVKMLKIEELNSDKSPKEWFLPEASMMVWRRKYLHYFSSDCTCCTRAILKSHRSGNVLEWEWTQTRMDR